MTKPRIEGMKETDMAKGQEQKKQEKKQAAKTDKEKKAEKKAKKGRTEYDN